MFIFILRDAAEVAAPQDEAFSGSADKSLQPINQGHLMRILVVGAGAIGGYFGGRLLQAGQDVTFLVRPKRASELASAGLVIKSPHGDVTLNSPPTVQADKLTEKFDVVLLSCKAFDLDDAIASFAPAVGPNTAIIPLLNGMRHLDVLEKAFGAAAVLGGQCQIAATLNERREVVQLAPMQVLSFGERKGGSSDRVRAIAEVMAKGNFGAAASDTIMQDMWEKWVFLATIAGCTSAMRAAVGDIVAAPGGRDFILGVRDECSAVAAANGFAPRPAFVERTEGMLTAEGSKLTASMYRDILNHAPIEADQIIGDLIARADAAKAPVPRLRMIYTHLKAYEAQRS
jgi:2-dehydropantoate 2-reductase